MTSPNRETVVVTPAMATEWLKLNVGNRPMKGRKVAAYERILRGGDWQTTTDAVGFSRTGRLINGQHRLQAIANTGIAAELGVQRGLADAAQVVIDRGSRRSAADALILSRGKFAPVAARVARSFMSLLGVNKNVQTDAEVVRHVETHSHTYAWLEATQMAKDRVPAPFMAALAYAYQVRPAQVVAFAAKVSDPVELPEASPVLHAIHISREAASSATERQRMLLRTLRCLMAYCEGEKMPRRSIYAKDVGLLYFQGLYDAKNVEHTCGLTCDYPSCDKVGQAVPKC